MRVHLQLLHALHTHNYLASLLWQHRRQLVDIMEMMQVLDNYYKEIYLEEIINDKERLHHSQLTVQM
jgi:hypothetical protein